MDPFCGLCRSSEDAAEQHRVQVNKSEKVNKILGCLWNLLNWTKLVHAWCRGSKVKCSL